MPTPLSEPGKPRVLEAFDIGDLERFYPMEAKRMGRESLVIVEVDVDAHGKAIDARVAQMDPADEIWGFGPSAVELARTKTRFSATGQPATLRMRVKFELQK